MPIQREQHRRGKDGVLDDGASFYQANESHMSLYDEAKRDLTRLEGGLGKALHALPGLRRRLLTRLRIRT